VRNSLFLSGDNIQIKTGEKVGLSNLRAVRIKPTVPGFKGLEI